MRVGLCLLGLLFAQPANASAQPVPVLYLARVHHAEAMARSGAGDGPNFYPTNRLPRSTVVEVVQELGNDWLQIKPPAGSFSWINMRFLEKVVPNQPTYMVKAAAGQLVPVLVGSDVNGDVRPTVKGCEIKRGSSVVEVGKPITTEDGMWLKIDPHPTEFRYIHKDAVTRAEAGTVAPTQVMASSFNPAKPDPLMGTGTTTAMSVPPAVTPARTTQAGQLEALQARAVQAERSGNFPEAILLYQQLGTEGQQVNRELAMSALDRAHWLRKQVNGQVVQGQPVNRQPEGIPARLPDPNGSRFTPTNPEVPPLQNATRQGSVGGYPFSTGPGLLRPATRVLENRKTYLMVTRDGRMISYVTPGPGMDLEQYVNREVEMMGQAIYRGDLMTNYMVVERVQLPGR